MTIWKCPVTERERTNNNGLLHATVIRDSSQLRQGMADYLLVFRKAPAQQESNLSAKPIARVNGFELYIGSAETDPRKTDYHPSKYARGRSADDSRASIEVWRRYAEPVWWDVNQTDVLNGYRNATGSRDERHICPLQLGLIERAVHIWSNPGDTVYSPFSGIGSEGVGAIRRGRKFIGSELKPEYFKQSISHLDRAVDESAQMTLF